MTTEEVLKELEARGLRVCLAPDGSTFLRGDKSAATPALLKVLARHKERVVEVLKPPVETPRTHTPQPAPEPIVPVIPPAVPLPPGTLVREWLWPDGDYLLEHPGHFCSYLWHPPLFWYPAFGDPDWHPIGAFWWRFEGDDEWLPVPGRNPERLKPPEKP